MKALGSIGESVRGFSVCVKRKPNRPIRYPAQSGPMALRTMERLQQRGCEVFALTDGNGGEETLSLQEMKSLFQP